MQAGEKPVIQKWKNQSPFVHARIYIRYLRTKGSMFQKLNSIHSIDLARRRCQKNNIPSQASGRNTI